MDIKNYDSPKMVNDLISKDEMNLAEYPLGLVSDRAPKGVNTITYKGFLTQNGKRVESEWTVRGSDVFGLPTGADEQFFMAIMEIWREQGFKDASISIGSIYHVLKKMNLSTDGRTYAQFIRAMNRYGSITITAKNALWDKESQSYIGYLLFHVIEEVVIYDKGSNRSVTTPLPLSYIKMNSFFHKSIVNGNIKDLNLSFYLKLPTPLSRRLFRYLDKKRYLGKTFTMDTKNLAIKLGFISIEKYYPSKLRQLLTPGLEVLVKEKFLERYSFEPSKDGEKLKVFFTKGGTRIMPILDTHQACDDANYVIDQILEVTKDSHSREYYLLMVKELGQERIFAILSETKQAIREGIVKTTPAKYFTFLAQMYSGKKTIVQ